MVGHAIVPRISLWSSAKRLQHNTSPHWMPLFHTLVYGINQLPCLLVIREGFVWIVAIHPKSLTKRGWIWNVKHP